MASAVTYWVQRRVSRVTSLIKSTGILPSTDLLLELLHLTRRLSHLDSELLLFGVRLRISKFR